MMLTSSAFENGGKIPKKYTCEGENISQPLTISEVPENAETLALIVLDIDVPQEFQEKLNIKDWDQWVVFNIETKVTEIPEGKAPGTYGNNTSGKPAYDPICPPTKHRYVFTLYALDTRLDLSEGASRADVEKVMEGHIIEKAELMGTYEKEK